MRRAHAWVIGAAAVFAPAAATAGQITADAEPQGIYGGGPVDACAWPATLWVGGCTASLVHPRMVVLAAHCVAFGMLTEATFGENYFTPSRTVDLEGCVAHPDWAQMIGDGNNDIAICELAEDVEDVPIVPVLMGCEAEILEPGATAWLVGFGASDDALGDGPKRAVETQIQQVGTDAIWVGDETHSGCYGDSGGPAYLQVSDGSWRVFGATSGAASVDNFDCPQTGVWTMIHPYVPWIEETSGIDITPCHDADGTWNPGEGCGAFPLAPGQGGGSWTEGCAGEASGMSASCGEAFDADAGTSTGSGGSSSSGGDGDESTGAPSDGSSSEGGGGTTGEPFAADDSGSTTAMGATDDEASGCGCSSSPRREAPMFAALSLLALARRRKP